LSAGSYYLRFHHTTVSGNGSLKTFWKHWYSVPWFLIDVFFWLIPWYHYCHLHIFGFSLGLLSQLVGCYYSLLCLLLILSLWAK
jgi:hypothetical protein